MENLREKHKDAPSTESGRARFQLAKDLILFTDTMQECMNEVKEKNGWGTLVKNTAAKETKQQEKQRVRENRPEVQKIDFSLMEKGKKAADKKKPEKKKTEIKKEEKQKSGPAHK